MLFFNAENTLASRQPWKEMTFFDGPTEDETDVRQNAHLTSLTKLGNWCQLTICHTHVHISQTVGPINKSYKVDFYQRLIKF